jgi:hypothetical protein
MAIIVILQITRRLAHSPPPRPFRPDDPPAVIPAAELAAHVVRDFVLLVRVEEFPAGRLVFGRRDPVPRDEAGKGAAGAGGAVEPAWCGFAEERFAQCGGEVVAVEGEEVVGGAEEAVGYLYLRENMMSAKGFLFL